MTEPLIQLRDICVSHGRRRVLDNVSLDVNSGDFIAITGPNGGGKTTLMRVILKLLAPDSGTVRYRQSLPMPAIGYLPQKNMIDARFPVTVGDVIADGLLGARDVEDRRGRVGAMLETVGLTAHASKPIGEVSGGQLQRALLGRALVSRPGLIVLDEPLSYVDKRFEQRIYDIVGNLRGKATVLLVSHEMSAISGIATRHLIVDVGLDECTAHCHAVHCECDDC